MFVTGLKSTYFLVQTEKGLTEEIIPYEADLCERLVTGLVAKGTTRYMSHFIEEYLKKKYVTKLEKLN